MVDAVILLCVIPGKEQEIKDNILELEEAKKCQITFGEYDLFIEIQAANVKSLGTFVTKEIRRIAGVTKSVTLIISESLENT
ncbi:MAG: Lrp/AsnC ligand binding domain-containing protein [Candidatus Heimdallarchaeota archaeon]|nr:Lrp/AsnC ligand binding domain-containing protein [Candidatus Heimdallarchaeota archaeon]